MPTDKSKSLQSNDTLVKLAFECLENGNWSKANKYCDTVLDSDSNNGHAYLGNLLAKYKSFAVMELNT